MGEFNGKLMLRKYFAFTMANRRRLRSKVMWVNAPVRVDSAAADTVCNCAGVELVEAVSLAILAVVNTRARRCASVGAYSKRVC